MLGFAFTPDQQVVLIRKVKPEWQAGKLNGVGGSTEEGESPVDAMVREFHEETGVLTTPDAWRRFGTMSGPEWMVALCRMYPVGGAKTMTAEEVITVPVDDLPKDVIPNLHWLVPMAWFNETYAGIVY